jgi:hypothetical protein
MRERIKARFDHEGIELARPTRVTIQREDKPRVRTGLPSVADQDPDATGAPDKSGAPATS